MSATIRSREAPPVAHVALAGTDLEVCIRLENDELAIEVTKADKLVYRVVIEQATGPIENAWIAEMFVRDQRVRLADLSTDVAEYLHGLDISQG